MKKPMLASWLDLLLIFVPVTFGLGDADEIESLTIRWPDGSAQKVKPDGVDRMLTIEQSTAE